jgi:hypothetical protein
MACCRKGTTTLLPMTKLPLRKVSGGGGGLNRKRNEELELKDDH